jgi:hypothetical protein
LKKLLEDWYTSIVWEKKFKEERIPSLRPTEEKIIEKPVKFNL